MSREAETKLPSPLEPIVSSVDGGLISKPWYVYLYASDQLHRGVVATVTTESTKSIIRNYHVTVINSTPAVVHELEDPRPGARALLILSSSSTQAGSVTVAAATDVAIGPGGENALSFPTSVSTYDLVELIGVNTTQYYIINQTTNVSVVASS